MEATKEGNFENQKNLWGVSTLYGAEMRNLHCPKPSSRSNHRQRRTKLSCCCSNNQKVTHDHSCTFSMRSSITKNRYRAAAFHKMMYSTPPSNHPVSRVTIPFPHQHFRVYSGVSHEEGHAKARRERGLGLRHALPYPNHIVHRISYIVHRILHVYRISYH
jgi:hypothetical protein